MNRPIVLLAFAAIVFVSCSKKSDEPAKANDTLLTKPMAVEPVIPVAPSPQDSGLYIDRARLRTPEHLKLLARFDPKQVVDIYHNFKPMRHEGLDKDSLDTYLKSKKITLDELKAVLEEGDRLGWNKAK